MTTKDFFKKWNNKGCDFDNFYGFQCMDLYQQFNKEVVGGNVVHGNAVDIWSAYPKNYYIKIANEPTNFPQEGDVIIWGQGVGQYGHIAVCSTADSMKFTSFDQNWPTGSLCHFQPHSYKYVLGWLRPNIFQPKPVITPPVTAPDPIVAPPVVETPIDVPPQVIDVPVTTPSVEPQPELTPVNELPTTPDVVPVKITNSSIIQKIVEWFLSILVKWKSKK